MRRVDTFSDAVFAIAITLLVVELPFGHVPEGRLGHALGEHWPRFLAYFASFGGIGIAWMHHHAALDQVVRLDRRLLLLNLGTLAAIAFIPFPTQLLGDYVRQGDDARIAAVMFSGAWTLATVGMASLWSHAMRTPGMLDERVDQAAAVRLRRIFRVTIVVYALLTVLAAISPIASVALYAPAAAFFLWRSDYRALERQPNETSVRA